MTYNSRLRAGAAFASLLCPLPAALAAPPNIAVQAGRWNVDYGDLRCSLSRRLGGPESPILTLTSYLGRDEPEMVLIRDGSEPLPDLPSRVEVVLSPGGQVEQGNSRRWREHSDRILRISDLREGFIDRFAASNSITLRAGGRPLATMRTPGAAAAVAALRACNQDLLRSWRVPDPSTYSRPARIRSGSLSHYDYPEAAIREDRQGTVVARLRVSPEGRVTECTPVVSSGHRVLDEQTCNVIPRRLRYDPALGADARPTEAIVVSTVVWRLPVD